MCSKILVMKDVELIIVFQNIKKLINREYFIISWNSIIPTAKN